MSPPRWLVPTTVLVLAAAVGVGGAVAVANRSHSTTAVNPQATPSASPTPTPSSSPTESASPTPSASSPATLSASPSASPRPSARPTGPARAGDVDGDGVVDLLSVVPRPGGYQLVARLSALGTQAVPLPANPGGGTPAVLGAVDVDGDGYAEVFVRSGEGASTAFAAVLRLVGGRLTVLTRAGTPAQLAYGGTVTHLDSWACSGGQIVTWSGESPDGTTYSGTQTTYRLAGSTLVQVSVRPRRVDSANPPPSGCGSLPY